MNESLNSKPKLENLSERMKNIQEVFVLCPELAKIGSPEQYEKYLETIFPESKVKDILFHNSDNEIKKFDRNHSFYQQKENRNRAFYFSANKDFWKRKFSYPALLNIEKIADATLGENEDFKNIITTLQKNGFEIGFETPITVEKVISEIKRKSPYIFEIPEIAHYLRINGFSYETPEGGSTHAVFEPGQIHILGSQSDIERFKEFVSKEK